jgi:hypothetical protein
MPKTFSWVTQTPAIGGLGERSDVSNWHQKLIHPKLPPPPQASQASQPPLRTSAHRGRARLLAGHGWRSPGASGSSLCDALPARVGLRCRRRGPGRAALAVHLLELVQVGLAALRQGVL